MVLAVSISVSPLERLLDLAAKSIVSAPRRRAASEKLVFVLARTSNPGAGELQDIEDRDGVPLYRRVARAVAGEWNEAGNCGLVVGATYPEEMAAIRADVPYSMPILIPGVGAQGGDLAATVAA